MDTFFQIVGMIFIGAVALGLILIGTGNLRVGASVEKRQHGSKDD
jgi:hypothetical protein